jgi:hypothetical protein
MKRFAEDVSFELGFDGELNEEVLQEAESRLNGLLDGTPFLVRTGKGAVKEDGSFTDVVDHAVRYPQQHSGWQSVIYKGQRYQLFGGIRTRFFICLDNPIVGNTS